MDWAAFADRHASAPNCSDLELYLDLNKLMHNIL
jgi:hypothetical protein